MTRPLLSSAQLREIARRYDGSTETINVLVRKFGCARHNITHAAKRLGVAGTRKAWTTSDCRYLEENYGRIPVDEICRALGRTRMAVNLQRKRMGISTRTIRDELGYTVYDLEQLRVGEHRVLKRFIEAGELRAHLLWVRRDEPQSRVIDVDALHRFLARRPEFVDYRNLKPYARAVLELDSLPDPPRYKKVVCRSRAFEDRDVEHSLGGGQFQEESERRYAKRRYRFSLKPCSERPFSFWVPIYETHPLCPRCGSHVSRFSERRLYRDDEPGEDDLLRMLAGKLGLTYKGGRLYDAGGGRVGQEDLLRYSFNTKRNPRAAFRVFAKLLATGLRPIRNRKVRVDRLKRTVLDVTLQPRQARAWQRFLAKGNLGVQWPPGEGKMFFLAYAYSRIPGDHVLFVNTATLAEQWAEFFEQHAWYGAEIRRQWKPSRYLVALFDSAGDARCTVQIYTYATRHDFEGERFQLAGYDEAHYLPGNRAHRLALLDARYRIGTTASPFREDGRDEFLDLLVGESDREPWADILGERSTPVPGFKVILVDDREAKLDQVDALLDRRRRTLIFVERIRDGKDLSSRLDLPFVFSETKERAAAIRRHRQLILSRVGDHGLDITDLQHVIEFGFFRGSRMQQLQRYGRLLHSGRRSSHLLLMTREEFTRYHKRLAALEERGIRFQIDASRLEGGAKSIHKLQEAA